MKKKFEKPSLETCEFAVAARLEGSGTAHSNGQGSACSQVASSGSNTCAKPSVDKSCVGNDACLY